MNYTIEQSPFAHFLFNSKKSALLWLVIRLYVGYEWILAGYEKPPSVRNGSIYEIEI